MIKIKMCLNYIARHSCGPRPRTATLLEASEERGMDAEDVWGRPRSGDAASSAVSSTARRLSPRVLCLGLGLGGSLSESERRQRIVEI